MRNVETGRGVARTVSDADGRFRFERVDPGAYVVELVSDEDKVLAIGDLFGVTAGGQATTFVRLSSKAPWFAGFFGNAAAAAISAASTLGVTAVGIEREPGEWSVDAERHHVRRPGSSADRRLDPSHPAAGSHRVDSRFICWIGSPPSSVIATSPAPRS